MGILSFFKKHASKGETIVQYLDKVDDLYMLAIDKKDVRYLDKYFSKNVIRYVEEIIHRQDIHFGLPKYRKRTWQMIDSSEESMLFRKELTYDHIKVTGKIYVPLGDDLVELWRIRVSENKLVIDITPESL